MRKKLINLILCLLINIVSYSQTLHPQILSDSTVIITYDQLKSANKLITEGKYYKDLYKESFYQISKYKIIIQNNEKLDSLRCQEIDNLNKKLQKTDTTWTKVVSIIGVILGIIAISK